MSNTHKPKTSQVLQRTIFAALATSLLTACPPAKEAADGGSSKKDGSADDADATTPRDATVPKEEAGAADAGAKDAAMEAGPKDASLPDAFVYVPIEATHAGSDAPTLTKVAYYGDSLGYRFLIKGRDVNGDVASYTIKLFNGTTPVSYDIDNDPDTAAVNQVTGSISPNALEAGFFVNVDTTLELSQAVNRVLISVTDQGGRTSNEMTASLTTTHVVASGACDPAFDICNSGSVCAKSGSSFACTSVSSARTSACNTALLLQPPAITSVRGQLRTYSLWDIPPSCGTDGTGEVDSVIKLKLASAGTVTLSTENDFTNFDTVLYYLDKGCNSDPTSCAEGTCFCSDDVVSPRTNKSRLTVSLPAGDHLFVVDSAASTTKQGDVFEVNVTVQ